ncbi:MAG: helix-turn-helix transcriptional regulator [Chitinophagaceae bacterium]|nr:helix-turn-helix transcriptional regulator [Chitinophagaceae bacterium]
MESKEKKSLFGDPEIFFKKVGARMRALRIKADFSSFEDFAHEHDIASSQYGRYERGTDMRMSTFIRILEALNITFEEFFKEGFD